VLNSFSMTLSEVVALIAEIVGRDLGVRYLPPMVAKIGGATAGGLFRVLGRDAPLCLESARTFLHGHIYDGSRATRELGLTYTSADATFRGLFDWARETGKL